MNGNWVMHRICVRIDFPQGVAVGAGRDGNRSLIARNGNGEPVVRGSTWAGLLRSELHRRGAGAELGAWFGEPLGGSRSRGRPAAQHIVVHDSCVLASGSPAAASTALRTHNHIDRHDGTVVDGGLFEVETAEPAAHCMLELWIKVGDDQDAQVGEFASHLQTMFTDGLLLGGAKARGIGLARAAAPLTWQRFDLANPDLLGAWLDVSTGTTHDGGESMAVGALTDGGELPVCTTDLVVDVTLVIPEGQDLLCGDGQAGDLALDVQRVRNAQGQFFRIPGSSLRGVMRGWFSRLAAREGRKVAYSHEVASTQPRWDGSKAASVTRDQCVVTELFGSAAHAGRIHITDALVKADQKHRSERTHVSVDHAWATSREGALFSNGVLTSGAGAFSTRIVIRDAQEHEAAWLGRTLLAIHLGLIRVGSSKAAGRLKVDKVEVHGCHACTINAAVKSITEGGA
jgi:CRISPR/Cas system CSM-associated protein Csm3 (group 7 of RAMP superfamily)